MFESSSYLFIILNCSAGLLALLGSVGIFVSLVIQRRVERLQDIIEELLDLSYDEGKNMTVQIQNLIFKYQMQYNLPTHPIRTVMIFINMTITLVIIFWVWLLFSTYRPPFKLVSVIYILPMFGVSAGMIFFRHLIKNTLNPVGNNLFNTIIPAPRFLRSIAFLSSRVNVPAGAIIEQARPIPVLRSTDKNTWEVILKQELPLDDYHYYFCLYRDDEIFFIGSGHVLVEPEISQETEKPYPMARNLNIPLGKTSGPLPRKNLEAIFMVFPKGENHPVEFAFNLFLEDSVFYSTRSPAKSVNYLVSYRFQKKGIDMLVKDQSSQKRYSFLPQKMSLDGSRWFFPQPGCQPEPVEKKPYTD